ncbi:MAG: hypothetical protein ACI8TP_001392 [Acidimicrobiales bacterium]|jgi:hypothetical protein
MVRRLDVDPGDIVAVDCEELVLDQGGSGVTETSEQIAEVSRPGVTVASFSSLGEYDIKGSEEVFWSRFHERTAAIRDGVERERILAWRWS